MSRTIILDCDPGHDDAMAILLAAQHLEVLGITTVGGNQTLDKVTQNALKVLELCGRTDIPVAAGRDRPLVQPPVHAPQFHGQTGLDGPILPEPTTEPHPVDGVDFIVQTAMSTDDLTLVATGPLTNVAAALHQEPQLTTHLREICLMGGSVTFGNWTPAAEFNIWCDPEAAHVVFASDVPKRMVGVNLTRQAVIEDPDIQRMYDLGTRTGEVAAELISWFGAQNRKVSGEGPALHDACAVAWLIDPSLIEGRPLHVTVELRGEYTRGMTVCDYRHLRSATPSCDIDINTESPPRGEQPNTKVGFYLDADRLVDLLIATFAAYP
jgi:inosine-uridine nucleoside N-ribohydrolase